MWAKQPVVLCCVLMLKTGCGRGCRFILLLTNFILLLKGRAWQEEPNKNITPLFFFQTIAAGWGRN